MIINYPKYLFFVLINTLLDIYFIKKVNSGLRDLYLICALEENFNFSYQLTFIDYYSRITPDMRKFLPASDLLKIQNAARSIPAILAVHINHRKSSRQLDSALYFFSLV